MEVGNSLAAVPIVQDSYGVSIQDRFLNYLRTAQHGTVSDSQSSESQDHLNEFVQQISVMKVQEHTTLSVDMSVLAAEDQELADCIIAEYDSCDSILCLSSYYRLAPFLNKAVQSFIDEKAPEYVFPPQSVHRLGQSRCRSKRIFCFLLQLQQPRPPSSPPHRFHRQALMHHRYGHSYNRSPP